MTTDLLIEGVVDWFSNLDYEYMTLHTIACYGLYYSKNLKWIKKMIGSLQRSIWIIGIILGIIEIIRFVPFFDSEKDIQKIVSVFHSFLLIQVFVEDLVKFVNNLVIGFRKKSKLI